MPSSKGFKPPIGKSKRTPDAVPVGDLVRGLMRERIFQVGGQLGQLSLSWEQIVGERLCSETAPVSLDRGILTVSVTSGAWGTQVGFLAKEIAANADEALGSHVVKDVRVVVRSDPRKPLQHND